MWPLFAGATFAACWSEVQGFGNKLAKLGEGGKEGEKDAQENGQLRMDCTLSTRFNVRCLPQLEELSRACHQWPDPS